MKAVKVSYYKYFVSTIAIIFLFLVSANAQQLKAGFQANSISGCAPILVNFQDTSIGNPTYWKWDLGNGTISYHQNPSTTYFTPGTYTIQLIVGNHNETDTIVKTSYITVFDKPVVNFTTNNTNGCSPLKIQFIDISSSLSDSIVQWQWDFGDGSISSVQYPTYTYNTLGEYNVKLKVTNSHGCLSAIEKDKLIKVEGSLQAGFNHTANAVGCTLPMSVSFSNTSFGTGVLNYQWFFGDGATSTEANPVHNYMTAGTYSVTLIVHNSNGCTDTLKKQNIINIGTVEANFNLPDSICAGTQLDLFNISTPSTIANSWLFGNGTFSTQNNPSVTYTTEGIYTIKLINDFGSCIDSVEKSIKVLAKPNADFFALDTASCSLPFQVQFTNNSMGGKFYQWNFGDGNTSTLQNPAHSFSSFGNYTVSLNVIGENGCSDISTKNNYIDITPLKISSISITPAEGCVPLDVAFEPSITNNDSIVQYIWHFGDSTSSNEKNPLHTYTTAGTYHVELKVISLNGCTDSLTIHNAVRVGDRPIVNFEANIREACTSSSIQFTDLTTNVPIDQWYWSFGDGKHAIVPNPLTHYQDTGWRSVKLVVWSNGCADSLTIPNYIHVLPPIAAFTYKVDDCNNPLKVVFADSSRGAVSYLWEFGDGTTSTVANPTHTYTASGTYQVKLTATNGDCAHTKIKTVTVDDKRGELKIYDSITCKNVNVNYRVENGNTAIAATYTWYIGENNPTSSGNVPSENYVYHNAGHYNVWVKIEYENGCVDTLFSNHGVQVYGAKADFVSPSEQVCSGATIHFTDASITDGIHAITQWTWDYGDGNIINYSSAPFSHTYTLGGNFGVKLKVTDSYGCVDSVYQNNAVKIAKTTTAFTENDTLVCPGTTVSFINQSTGNNLAYQWNFGDGNTATEANPEHNYPNEGTYTIRLSAIDPLGCADTLVKINHIKVYNPVANFSISDSTAVCPPLLVNATNNSLYAGNHYWSFGNGSTSTQINPSHLYVYPGNYTIQLVVNNTGGCADTASKQIIINGPTGTFSYTPTIACNPVQVHFSAVTQNTVSNTWDFNNGVTNVTTQNNVSYTYTTGGHYLPKLILEDAAGCRVPVLGTDTIQVKHIHAAMFVPSTTVCDSATIQFIDSSATNDVVTQYVWNFGNGQTSTQANPYTFYNANGFYTTKLKVVTQTGCSDSVTYSNFIKVVSSPTIKIEGDSSVCLNSSLQFNAIHLNPDTSTIAWNWNFGNGNTYTIQNPPAQTFSLAGNNLIEVKATNSSGCYNIATQNIQVHELPNIHAGNDTLLCRNQSITLQATGGNTYNWYGNVVSLNNVSIANPIATPFTTVTYYVKGTSMYNCDATDSVTIQVQQPLKINVVKADTLCLGQTAKITASGTENYQWYPTLYIDNEHSAEVNIKPAKDTLMKYMLLGWDNNNCFTDTAYVHVKTYPIPQMNIEQNDITVNAGSSVVLKTNNSSDVTKWKWTPNKYIDNPNIASPTMVAKESITYTCVASNDGNCVAREEVKVIVVCNGGNIFVPNTFSPNGDGVNDVFYPRGKGVYTIKSFRIFNRWGEMVFEKTNFQANDMNAGWDGTYKGIKQPTDAYVYSLEIMCDNSVSIPSKGSITLLR
ncbi:MAG: PKD domain-containing protein [Chitinophagaceae bacterium]|nr:PKD domain-containing protein [Chitinophagaceae bacterium]MCW5905437.1 PKD domain-containing protein [Chitinophagaceae bacterium]